MNQCDFGNCGNQVHQHFTFKNELGKTVEVRGFCKLHATDPRFAFARPKDLVLRRRLARKLEQIRAGKGGN